MKTCKLLFIIAICVGISFVCLAQVPQGVNYQAVARDAAGKALADQSVNVKIALQEGAAGTVLYEESHQLTTDVFGLFTLTIGQGSPLSGAFEVIDWGSGAKFLQVAIDPEGGDNFIDLGTTQLLSVPYALYAEKSGDTSSAQTLHPGKGIAIANDSLTNTGDTDAMDDVTITSEAEGDVSGKFSALKVEKLQGTKLDIPDSIRKEAVLKWDGEQWKPGPDSTVWHNSDSLIFYPKGNVGIGIVEPEALLHVNRQALQDDTVVFPMLKLTTTDTASATMGGSGTSGLNIGLFGNQAFITSSQQGIFSIGTDTLGDGSLALMAGGENHVTLLPNGRVGFGTSDPLDPHHVHAPNSSSSFSRYTNQFSGKELGDGLGIGLRNSTAIIFNNEPDGRIEITGHGGVRISNVKTGSRADVNITENGVGIITTEGFGQFDLKPTHELHLRHQSAARGGATAGLKIENQGSNRNWWAFYTTNSSGELEMYYKGSLRGEFDPGDGEYRQRSDGRLKRAITPLPSALDKVLQLKPSTYYFKDDENSTHPSLGFIAQEVQPLFPELVGYSGEEQDILTLNYDGFGVLAIKAIQEQQTKITHQQQRIDQLQEQVIMLQTQINELYHLMSLRE